MPQTIPDAGGFLSNTHQKIMIFLLIVSIVMFIVSFSMLSKYAGHEDKWNVIQEQVTKTFIFTWIGTFFLMMGLILFIIQDPVYSMPVALILSTIAIGLSFSSLSVSVISR